VMNMALDRVPNGRAAEGEEDHSLRGFFTYAAASQPPT
jgi:hypothetical protein